MYTQLFGQYLLTHGIVPPAKLAEAFGAMKETRVRLGALAIDAGFLTARQADYINELQKTKDMRFGDLAVANGYLTEDQVKLLLSRQKSSNIVLGQALIDLGILSRGEFESALKSYKNSSMFADGKSSDRAMKEDIIQILGIEANENRDFYARYLLLLVRNFIRFIGDDFTFGGAVKEGFISFETACVQEIKGAMPAKTMIGGDCPEILGIASRFAGEYLKEPDEYAKACVGELLNLQNGLFIINVSNESGIELDLTPQEIKDSLTLDLTGKGICVKLLFSFGTVCVALLDM